MTSYNLHHQHLHQLRLHHVSPSPCKPIHVSSSVPKLLSPFSCFTKPPNCSSTKNLNNYLLFHNFQNPYHFSCKFNNSDIASPLEHGKPVMRQKPEKRVTGIFWIILLNLGIYAADHVFQIPSIKALYLYHNWPVWYQFVTSAFCHYDWQHLSSNLFFLYIFGAGANLVSWLLLPRNVVSIGASGAVFGLFTISVIVKISRDWRKILEFLILGQFVIEKVMEAAQCSSQLAGDFQGVNNILMNVNHLVHLSGALVGVVFIWLLSRVPSPSDDYTSKN